VLTGVPVRHFVLLLQEARRTGSAVPDPLAADARTARRLGERDAGPLADIVATAERLGLRLFYVPSMRNGGRDDAAEDRGNAILTTLPLTDLTAIELPLLAQRRVAVAATIPLLDASNERRALRVSSVHLDYGASRTRPLAPFGPGRALQAAALANALDAPGNVIVGGDFNTWMPDRMEGGLARMVAAFPDLPGGRTAPTHYTAGLVPQRLDHLFLRAADVAGTAPVRIDDRYGSDHFPVIVWVRLTAPAAGHPTGH
jgi:endonuclease/exonuclease/phosphatase family metal-dependent hydrolase